MIAAYGRNNGFGWKPNEVIAAQIVSVPMALPVKNADLAFRNLVIYFAAIFLLSVAVIDVALYFIVIRPLRKLSKAANLISQGNLEVPELAVKGKDEIAATAASFNRLYLSLKKAAKMLNG